MPLAWTDFYGIGPERLARFLRPETLRTLGPLVAALVVCSILVRVRATYAFDLSITRWLQRLNGRLLDRGAFVATWLGNSSTVIGLSVLVGAVLFFRGMETAAVLLVGMNLSLVVSTIVKNVVDRARPGETDEGVRIHGGPRWSFSYPSGHSMGAAAVYGFLATLVYLSLGPGPAAALAIGAATALVIAIGLSRIYLGAHWLSDVVGGWTGGAMFVLMGVVLYRP